MLFGTAIKFGLIGAFCGLANTAMAGPFGIEMGQSPNDLKPLKAGAKTLVSKVPKPHPDFEHYAVWSSDKTGVCAIIAISKTYENDRYGIDVRADFAKFQKALEKKYGKAKKVDFKRNGALWKDAEDWVMAIRQNERIYGADWQSPEPDGNDDSVASIDMSVLATRSDSSMIKLQYKLKNFETCNAAINEEAGSSF